MYGAEEGQLCNNSFDYKLDSFKFKVKIKIDNINKRLWVNQCEYQDIVEMQRYLLVFAEKLSFEKVILPVKDLKNENYGHFTPEGRVKGFFNGEDCIFLAGYVNPRRGISLCIKDQNSLLDDVLKKVYVKTILPAGYEIRKAVKNDAKEMAGVFKSVFKTYPSPVFRKQYLVDRMNAGDCFWLALNNGRIAAISSAEIDYNNSRAEMTDFATLPEYRGLGLASVLLGKMGEQCRSLGINCLFSLARASSFGINSVFCRHGYHFGGTLINNCHICGKFENMNVWYK